MDGTIDTCFSFDVSSLIQEAVSRARNKDRIRIEGRPLFVSPFKDREGERTLMFPTGADPKTLYVSNLAREVSEEELNSIFTKVCFRISRSHICQNYFQINSPFIWYASMVVLKRYEW